MIKIIKNKIFILKNKRFVRDVSILQFGSLFSRTTSFLASIIYARILGATGYASYALIFAFVSLFGIFMNVGTNETAITLLSEAYAKNNKEKIQDVITYYLKITFLFAISVGLLIIILAPFLTIRLYNNREIGSLARIIVLANIAQIFYFMYTIVLQIMRKIKQLAIIENFNKFFGLIVPVGLVLFGFGLRGLVFGYLIVALIFAIFSIIAYYRLSIKNPNLPSWGAIFMNLSKVRLSYYFKFGFLIAIDKNLASLYSSLPIFILGMFGLNQVAFFKIAVAYASLPSIFLTPISRLLMVQLPKSKTYNLKILKRDFLRSSFGGFFITLFVSIACALLGWLLIPGVYGQEYTPAITWSYFLILGSLISSLGVGLSSIFRTLNLMKKVIIINLTSIILGGSILYFLAKNYSIDVFVFATAFWLPIVTLVFLFYIIKYLNHKLKYEFK